MLPVKFIRDATSYLRKSTIVAIDHSYQVVGEAEIAGMLILMSKTRHSSGYS
jgi:hypothetical protein